jgi:hypothetical protein
MPAVVGLIFDGKYEFGQLACLDGVRAIGPDGKIMHEHGRSSGVGTDRIVAVSPPPGTPIGRHDQVTVNVAPGGIQLCPVVGTPAVRLGKDNRSLSASRRLTSHHKHSRRPEGVDDAATEFEFQMAHGNATVNSVSGLGVQAACVLRYHPSGDRHHLWLVLPGERIYIASDSGDPDDGPASRATRSPNSQRQQSRASVSP